RRPYHTRRRTKVWLVISALQAAARTRAEGYRLNQSGFSRSFLEADLETRADLLDDQRRRQRTKLATVAKIEAACIAVEEARSVEIACASGVHDLANRFGLDINGSRALYDDGAVTSSCDNAKLAVIAKSVQGRIQGAGLVEGFNFVLVGEDDVDRPRTHQIQELVAKAIDAERVRKRHGHLPTALMRHGSAPPDCFLRVGRIPEVTFKIGHLGSLRLVLFHILRPELGACAEVGVHGSLAIWRHEDHGARGGRKIAKRSRIECYALRANIMAVDIAELVLCDLSEIGGAPAQASQAGSR